MRKPWLLAFLLAVALVSWNAALAAADPTEGPDTSRTDGVGEDIGAGKRAVATYASKDHKLFAHVHGTLVPSDDKEVIERLWNPIIASWYKDGKDDPDLLLLRFDTEKADIWEASAGATLKAAALKALFDIDPGKEHQKDNQASVTL